MGIPIYSQQVAPPHPPRLRKQVNPEAAKAAAIAKVAGQVQQAGTAFAGRLFDLAAQNEINSALITAKEEWQTFQHELQTDPEYTAYQEKFDTFYSGLRDTIWGKLRMPKAKTELEQRLKAQKIDWEVEVQQYSDDRAIEHAFTTMERGINIDIVNQDQFSVNQKINEAIATGVVAESDGEHLRQMSLAQIHANILGFPDSVLWLSTEEPTTAYGISREERLGLLRQYKGEWAAVQAQNQAALGVAIEATELDFMDRFQKKSPPGWEEIRDSKLPQKRKEHYQNLLNEFTDKQLEDEEDRLDELKTRREEAEAQKNLEAFDLVYKELIDFPLGKEEEWENRVMSDPVLTGGKTGQKQWLIAKYRQRSKADREAATKTSPLEVTNDSTMAELIRMFYDSDVPNDTVKAFIQDKHGFGLSNTDSKTWLDKLKKRQPYQVYDLAVNMVKKYYDDKLREEKSTATILTDRKQEALIIKQIADEAAKGKLTQDGLLQFAANSLVEPKRQRTGGLFSRMETEEELEERTEPEVKEPSAVEAYNQEMTERFTEWKGVAPVDRGEIDGEAAFFDGAFWYVYRRRSWYRWDGKRWQMTK